MRDFLKLKSGVRRAYASLPSGAKAHFSRLKQVGDRLTDKQRVTSSRSLPESAETTPIFFVIGRLRSGTTWLMRLLNAHPEILCRGEGRFFGRNWREEKMKDLQVRKQPSSLHHALQTSEYLRYWVERSVWSRDEDTEEHMINLTRLAVNYFLTRKLSESGKKMVGDKTPLVDTSIVEEISQVYPGAKVIHIVRDGRDAAVSLTHYMWNNSYEEGGLYTLDPEELTRRESYRQGPQQALKTGESIFTRKRIRKAARVWNDRVGDVVDNGPTLVGANYKEVRYEDLLERPTDEAKKLLQFLGADSSEGVVTRCVRATSFERRAKGRARGEEDNTSSAARKSIASDWRNVFTERDRQIFKEEAGDLLIKLGYEKDDNW